MRLNSNETICCGTSNSLSQLSQEACGEATDLEVEPIAEALQDQSVRFRR